VKAHPRITHTAGELADASDALEAVGESAVLEVRMMLSGLESASPISQDRPNLR